MERPQSIQEFLDLMTRFRSAEADQAMGLLSAHRSDVFISTFAKSGTTWMQQIVHQLRSNASNAFEDIYEVVPWMESALDMNIDLDAQQQGKFRAFKSHQSYENLPKKARYICVFRDPATVIPSWFRFFEGWLFETDSISLDEFAREFYLNRFTNHQAHFEQWFRRIDDADTLVLCYEHLVLAPDRVPAIVADFLQIEIDDSTMSRVIEHSSRGYMYKNKSKFSEKLLRRHIDRRLGLPPGGQSSKVNQSATVAQLSNEVLDQLAHAWNNTVRRNLGFESYLDLSNAVPNPMKSTHYPKRNLCTDTLLHVT